MNTKLLMISSSIVLAVAGIAFSFLPHEILIYLGLEPVKSLPLILQLAGSLYIGFAMLNWMAKANLIGGIYSRPVAMGNFMHFFVGALALIKSFMANTGMKIIMIPVIIYILFAVLFGLVVFGKGIPKNHQS